MILKKTTDKGLDTSDKLFNEVLEESENQLDEWGVQTHSLFEWLAYLTEEVGELSQAISEYQYRNGNKIEIRKETIQVATLALKIAEMIGE